MKGVTWTSPHDSCGLGLVLHVPPAVAPLAGLACADLPAFPQYSQAPDGGI